MGDKERWRNDKAWEEEIAHDIAERDWEDAQERKERKEEYLKDLRDHEDSDENHYP